MSRVYVNETFHMNFMCYHVTATLNIEKYSKGSDLANT